MTYQRGTIAEFNAWHSLAMVAEEIPPEGRIGMVNGIAAPQNQRTMAYSNAIQNPVGGDDYIWLYGKYIDTLKPALTLEEAKIAGWFVDE